MSSLFSHEELEVKRRFLEIARDFHEKSTNEKTNKNDQIAFELASALIYMNVADYLAEYLFKNIHLLAQEAVSRYYFGSITFSGGRKKPYNIGESISQLKKYEFPRKKDILVKLDEVKRSRNLVAHEMLKTKASDLLQIDQAVGELAEYTEELINLIDEIQMGMPPKNLLELVTNQNPQDIQDKGEDGK